MTEVVLRTSPADEAGLGTFLAIDTALGSSVALSSRGVIIEASSDDARGHAEHIGTLIERVLAEADIPASAIEHVVAGMGPGPFTGLRVGIAAAHAFALGRGVAMLPVVSHDAAALEALSGGAVSSVRVVQDAKRRELFVTEYSGLDCAGVPVRSLESRLVAREGFVSEPNDVQPLRIPASGLVRIAARKLASGQPFEADQALYLRLPDVMQPTAPKPVLP